MAAIDLNLDASTPNKHLGDFFLLLSPANFIDMSFSPTYFNRKLTPYVVMTHITKNIYLISIQLTGSVLKLTGVHLIFKESRLRARLQLFTKGKVPRACFLKILRLSLWNNRDLLRETASSLIAFES